MTGSQPPFDTATLAYWTQPEPDRGAARGVAKVAGIVGLGLLGAAAVAAPLLGAAIPLVTGIQVGVMSFAGAAIVGVVSYRNSLKGFPAPINVLYKEVDPELGASFPDLGVDLANKTFENVIRAQAEGRDFTYFEAVDRGGRVGYLVIPLPGRLPDIVSVSGSGSGPFGNGLVRKRPDPYRAKVGVYQFPVLPEDPERFFATFRNPSASRAMGLMEVRRWWIHGRHLVALPMVNYVPRPRAWPKLKEAAGHLATIINAIPVDAYEPDDSLPAV